MRYFKLSKNSSETNLNNCYLEKNMNNTLAEANPAIVASIVVMVVKITDKH